MKTFNVNSQVPANEASHIALLTEATNRGWAYRYIIGRLWDYQSVQLDSQMKSSIALDAMLEGEDLVGEPIAVNVEGHLRIIRNLDVPVMSRQQFARRTFIKPQHLEAIILHVWQQTGGEVEIDWLLTPKRREQICRLALLEPNSLDECLSYMLNTLKQSRIQAGTSAGTYGRFLRII